jgi:hypothetical protein
MRLNSDWLRPNTKHPIVRTEDVRDILHGFSSLEKIVAMRARMGLYPVAAAEAKRYEHVVVENYWLERPLGDDWIAAYRYTIQEGRPVVSELRVFPSPVGDEGRFGGPGHWKAELLGVLAPAPAGGLTARHVHNYLRMGRHAKLTRDILARLRREAPQLFAPGQDMAPFTAASGARAPVTASGRGRKGHGVAFFARIAKEYVDVIQRGDRRPATTIASRRGLSPARVRDLIHRARQRGLLTPAHHGRRGGLLTPAARAILGPSETSRRTAATSKSGGRTAGPSSGVPVSVPAATRKRPTSALRQPTRQRKTPR